MKALTFLASRFVAGETAAKAVKAAKALNARGLKATLDHLGEDSTTRRQAESAAREYVELLERIADAGVDCNVSLKLTQMGLAIDPSLARDNLAKVAEKAKGFKNFVRVDMESSAWTDPTLALFYELYPTYPNMGVVIQAMLRRSEDDVRELVNRKVRVRLCKGAYKETVSIAFPTKKEVNANYDKLAALLMKAPNPAIATHDDERIEAACRAAQRAGVKKGRFEIQMLYGLRSRRWDELAADGHVVRVYVPYGTHWFPYFYRRIRERKENLLFVVRNLFR